MLFRNPIPLMCMRSQHRVTFLYLSVTPLGTFGTTIGSTCWTLWWTVWFVYVAHWVHIFPRPSRHLLAELGDSVGCCYQPHVGFALLFGRRCSGIAFRSQNYLHHGRCTVSSFPPPVGWRRVNHSPWCVHFFEKVTHIVVEKTSIGNLECWLLWDMNEKFIPILTIISHYMVFLYQSEWQDVGDLLWIIPYRIWVSR